MIAAFKHSARFMLMGLIAVLSACGGGGGGGGSNGPSYQVSPSSITFTAPDSSSSAPAPQTIDISVTSGDVVLGTSTFSGAVISSLNQIITGNTTAQITVYPSLPSSLGKGTHTGSVMIHACANSNCSSEIAGSPRTIAVTYQIEGFSATPASISLSAVEGESPVAKPELISHSTGSNAWTTSVAYDGATTGWATLSPSSGTTLPATLSVGATTLNAGIYTAAMQLSIPGNNLLLPITYTVAKAMAPSPAALNYMVGESVTPSDISRTVSVATNYVNNPGKTIAWNAASDVAWLGVNPSTGNTGSATQLTATLDQAQVGQLLNGTYSGGITLSSTALYTSSVIIPVTLTVDRAQINYVSPYVATAGGSAEVIIRGKHFSQVTVQDVTFGGISASAFHVVSDTEIRATHPAFAAGQYPVSAVTTTGSIASRAVLVVTNPTTLANLTFLHPGVYKGIIHESERGAILVFPMGGNYIERHIYNGSSWSSTSVTLPYYIYGAGQLSPDGKEIVLSTQDDRLMRLDANSLNVLSVTNPLTTYPTTLRSIAVLNDGNVLVATGGSSSTSLSLFNLSTRTLTPLANGDVGLMLSSIRTTGDGSRALLRYDNYFSPASNNLYSFDAGTGQFAPITAPIVGSVISLDRTGARTLSNYSNVYDASLTLLGNLPFSDSAVISQDGTRAYTHYFNGSSGLVYSYNLTAATVNGYFSVIGNSVSAPSWLNSMSISSDGRALFLIESSQLTVVPLP